MKNRALGRVLAASILAGAFSCRGTPPGTATSGATAEREQLAVPGEVHLRNIRQLTFGGENAEAYFSPDGKRLIFQSSREGVPCDQIFVMNIDGSGQRMVSTGKGRTTCAYFFPDGSRILYASTHHHDPECPPPPPRGARYVWAVYKTYDIFSARLDGSDLRQLTDAPGYDAEATIAPDGSRVVFTSARDGDLELYTMNLDGSDQRRLTHAVGYDGGAFYSADSRWICFRASRPQSEEERRTYFELLEQGLVEPTRLEIFVMPATGGEPRQVTHDGAANFCPFFHPSGTKIIYASNKADPRRRNFDLFLLDLATGSEERITYHPDFDGFPMFSPDGKLLVWASNRNNRRPRETNVLIAEWVEEPARTEGREESHPSR